MVSYLGEGLNILISCEHTPGHSWMSYICWYSIKQNLPDAKVSVVCSRKNVSGHLFLWTKKLNIPFRMYKESDKDLVLSSQPNPTLVVPPYCLVLRDFEESGFDPLYFEKDSIFFLEKDSELFCSVKSDEFKPFYSYKDGWGYFILNDWINKEECPLSPSILKRLPKGSMSFNEKKTNDLWNLSLRLFQTVSGGVTL